MMSAHRQPTLYIPHGGGPCFFMDWSPLGPKDTWDRTGAWLRGLADSLPKRPRAILVASAHWEEAEFAVQADARPALIYDYEGFPPETYRLEYPAPGSPALAARVAGLLRDAGLPAVERADRGYDHGVFVPLKLAFPAADVPIVQLSLRRGLDPGIHLRAGAALAPLRDEGVLILGSGMSSHNLRDFFHGGRNRSEEFDAWLTRAATAVDPESRAEALRRWIEAPAAREAHPREEHLLPLMIAVGAAGDGRGTRVFTDAVMGQRISAYLFDGSDDQAAASQR